MSDSGQHILFYSNKCLHSKELLNMLHKDVDLNQKFTKINIDNPNIKIPPYVKAVPTAIIQVEGKPNLMVGSNIFKWFTSLHKKKVETQSIQDWDPHTMTGYSDGFSYIANQDVMKKSFSFLTDSDNIITPDEKNYGSEKSNKDKPKTQLDNDYETFMNNRSYEVPSPAPRM